MIYCSNLCTEIAQNMAPSESVSTEIRTHEGDTVVVKTIRPGDFVVCNLASLSLGHLPLDDSEALRQKVATVVRALDNVIDLNFYPVPYAQITNHRYRSIGLGVSGYHHALALRGIRWESEELLLVDQLFEQINFAAIEASNQLAAKRAATPTSRAATGRRAPTSPNAVTACPLASVGPASGNPRYAQCLLACRGSDQQHEHHCRHHGALTR